MKRTEVEVRRRDRSRQALRGSLEVHQRTATAEPSIRCRWVAADTDVCGDAGFRGPTRRSPGHGSEDFDLEYWSAILAPSDPPRSRGDIAQELVPSTSGSRRPRPRHRAPHPRLRSRWASRFVETRRCGRLARRRAAGTNTGYPGRMNRRRIPERPLRTPGRLAPCRGAAGGQGADHFGLVRATRDALRHGEQPGDGCRIVGDSVRAGCRQRRDASADGFEFRDGLASFADRQLEHVGFYKRIRSAECVEEDR